MLTGDRVALRAVEEKDLPQLLKWRNAPKFRRFFREYRELNMSQQLKWFQNIVQADERVRMFAIVEPQENRLVGACGLCYIDWVNRNADLSIYIGHKGLYIDDKFAPEAAALTLDYGFDELCLHRIWTEIYAFDERKTQMYDTLGFTLDGRHRESHWSEGTWHDSLFYGILNREWQARQSGQ